MLQDAGKKVHYQTIAGRCNHDIGVPTLNRVHDFVTTSTLASSTVAHDSDIADLITNQRHRSWMESRDDNISQSARRDWDAVIVQTLNDYIGGMHVIGIR